MKITSEQIKKDVEYLDITEFNYHHWIGNKMEDY